eukprot:TRINITY_DN2323_c0_g2_i1.p4 TRINITY_DN2323_c0_g2~~TRINITY_DN2323_c0_g2_i1.p4  ORF type:complete len:136 (-),score=6.09 TRINITY_DN2323_c0_g2_i1:661-1068(-)
MDGGYILYYDGLGPIMESMKTNTTISHLTLCSTALEAKHIWTKEHSAFTQYNQLIDKACEYICKGIADMLAENKAISKLDLTDNDMGQEDIRILIKGLECNHAVMELDLGITVRRLTKQEQTGYTMKEQRLYRTT